MITVTARTLAGDIYLREYEDGFNTVERFLDEVRPELRCGPYDAVEVLHPKSYSSSTSCSSSSSSSSEEEEEDNKQKKVNRMRSDNLMKDGVEYLLFVRPFRVVVEKCVLYLNSDENGGNGNRQHARPGRQGRQGRRGRHDSSSSDSDSSSESDDYDDEDEDEEVREKEDVRNTQLTEIIDFTTTYYPSILTVPTPMTWQEADMMFHDELNTTWKSIERMGKKIVRAYIFENEKVEEMVLDFLTESLEYKRMLKGYRLAEYGKISKFFER